MKPRLFFADGVDGHEFLNDIFDYYGVKDRTIRYSEFGKPYLVSNELFFNLSHCDGKLVCCVADREVGVDIQRICYRPRVLKKVCSPDEAAGIKTPEDFTRMWVLKESFVKCDGRGLAYGLKNIDSRRLKEVETWRCGDFLIAACYNVD